MVDSGRDNAARSISQQQQKQQAEKRQGGVAVGEAVRSVNSQGVVEVSGGSFQARVGFVFATVMKIRPV